MCNSETVYYSATSSLYIFQHWINLEDIEGEDYNETAWLVGPNVCDNTDVIAAGTANLNPWESLLWYVKDGDNWKIGYALAVLCTNCSQQDITGTTTYPQVHGTYEKEDNTSLPCAERVYTHKDGNKYLALLDVNELRWHFFDNYSEVCIKDGSDMLKSQPLDPEFKVDPHNVLIWEEYFKGNDFWNSPSLDVTCIGKYSRYCVNI